MNDQLLHRRGLARSAARRTFERAHRRALEAAVAEVLSGGNVSRAAELVGVTRRTIYRALEAAARLAELEARAGGPPAPAPHDTDREPEPKGKP